MSLLLSNNILQAAEKKLESQLTPENHQDYLKVVVAGLKVALQKGPDSAMAALRNSKDPINDCAIGAINLCLLMRKQSRGTMPVKAMVPAAMTLMLHALDFVDKAGIAKVGEHQLIQATHTFTNHIFKALHITPNMIHSAAAKLHQIVQDPTKVELMKRKAGLVKAPNASEPTFDQEPANGV